MRLNNHQCNIIVNTCHKVFGERARIFLFGSRVDDAGYGGDIDLLVDLAGAETGIEKKIRFQSLLQIGLGEQKIDVVLSQNPLSDNRLVVKEALSRGVFL